MLPGKAALMAVDDQSRQISSCAAIKVVQGDLGGYDFDRNRDSYGSGFIWVMSVQRKSDRPHKSDQKSERGDYA